MLKTVAMDSISARKLDRVSGSLESFGITLDAIKTTVVLDRELPDDLVWAARGATPDWWIVMDTMEADLMRIRRKRPA
jgi:hypothetical protein